jgi:hypothetical protein
VNHYFVIGSHTGGPGALGMTPWSVGFAYPPSLQVIISAISLCSIFFSEMGKDIWKELRLNLCGNCRTRLEPVFSSESEICPLCGWIMVNMALADFKKKDGPQLTDPPRCEDTRKSTDKNDVGDH